MKPSFRQKACNHLFVFVWGLIFLASSGRAMYWDANGPSEGAGGPTPAGTWGLDAYWTPPNQSGSAGTLETVAWVPGQAALFSAGTDANGTFTINVLGTQLATTLTFEEGDITLTGGMLDLTNGTIAVNSSSGTIFSVITNSHGLGITKSGPGILTLGATNVYSGPTTIVTNGGTLRLGANEIIPDGSALTVFTNGTFHLNGFNETVGSLAGNGTLVLNGNLTIGGDNASTTFSGNSSGAGRLIKVGSGVLSLTTSNGFSGGVSINAGTVRVNSAYALGVPNSPVTLSDGVMLSTTGGTARSMTNAYTIDGNITLGQASGGTAAVTLAGTVDLNGATRTITVVNASDTVSGIISNGGLIKDGTGTLVLTAANTYSGPTTVNSGAIQLNSTGTLGDGTGTVTLSGGNLFTSQGRANNPIPNPVVLLSDTVFQGNTAGAGYRYFPFTGPITTISGTLTVKNNGTANGIWTPRFHGSFDFTSEIILGVAGDAGAVQIASFNTTTAGEQIFSGVISGYGSFDRSASVAGTGGRTVLTAANTYTGGTTVNDGTLLVNNTIGSGTGTGPVVASTNGVLSGTGIISGPVTVNAGATLSPGASIGTLTINNNLTLSGNTLIEINKTANTFDRVAGINTLTAGGTLLVTNASGVLAAGDSFPIFDAATYTGSFTNIAPAPGSGLEWSYTNGVLSVVQGVLEPPSLQFTVSSNMLNFSWSDPAAVLQQTFDLGASPIIWENVPGSTGTNFQVNTSDGTRFFRLKR